MRFKQLVAALGIVAGGAAWAGTELNTASAEEISNAGGVPKEVAGKIVKQRDGVKLTEWKELFKAGVLTVDVATEMSKKGVTVNGQPYKAMTLKNRVSVAKDG